MASGVGLVTSAVGGSAELLPYDGCGFRYEPGNASDLAGVLRSMVVILEYCSSVRRRDKSWYGIVLMSWHLLNS